MELKKIIMAKRDISANYIVFDGSDRGYFVAATKAEANGYFTKLKTKHDKKCKPPTGKKKYTKINRHPCEHEVVMMDLRGANAKVIKRRGINHLGKKITKG